MICLLALVTKKSLVIKKKKKKNNTGPLCSNAILLNSHRFIVGKYFGKMNVCLRVEKNNNP